ncbi:MAG: helix-turn-helix domain-containing protein [Clostridiales bacterium]|nr:helix-turn-helix domain-containing protein [Clostridiales bacterium]
MEFNEKLQELRKGRSMTQEELAEALFVSRTAVSKWESGRGYPGIDSLKAISRFFSVSVDELICPEEMLSVAENEKRSFLSRWIPFICGTLDLLPVILLFVPLFGNGAGTPSAVSLMALDGISGWIRTVFLVTIALTVLNGLCGLIISQLDRPVWNRHRLVTGIALSVAGTALFMITRQPYAGIIYLSLLVVKGILLIRADVRSFTPAAQAGPGRRTKDAETETVQKL